MHSYSKQKGISISMSLRNSQSSEQHVLAKRIGRLAPLALPVDGEDVRISKKLCQYSYGYIGCSACYRPVSRLTFAWFPIDGSQTQQQFLFPAARKRLPWLGTPYCN